MASTTNSTPSLEWFGDAAFASVTEHWPAFTTSTLFILAVLFLQYWSEDASISKIPIIGKGGKSHRRKQFIQPGGAWKIHSEGYQKFKDGIYRITTARETDSIMISANFLPELRKLPDDVLSFGQSVAESLQSKFTGIGTDPGHIVHTVKGSLTPALPRLNPMISDEVIQATNMELPQSSEWSEVKINTKLLRIVAMVSGRVFVGPDLCHSDAYLDAAINYTIDLMAAVYTILYLPVWLRPIVGRYLTPVKKLQRRIEEADEILRPVVTARRASAEEPGYKKPDDMLQWIMDSREGLSDKELARAQLDVSFAAIHTTTMMATNAFYTLASMPEIVPMLREDVQQAVNENGGDFTSLALQNMKKLDSFLREVLRYYPGNTSSFQRKVLKSFTLSNGQTIPAGYIVEVPSAGVAGDPTIFPEPEVFDPLRFYKLRKSKTEASSAVEAAGTVAHSQFVSVSPSSLNFGYGRHACPGRFFAANEIKMIVATMVLRYEMRLPDGVTERYPNVKRAQQSVPDPTKTVMIRRLEE